MKSRRMRGAGHVAHIGGDERCIQGFGEKLEKKDPLEDSGLDGRIILRWNFGIGVGDMNWIDLAQERDRWWSCVNAVMNLLVP